MQLRRNGNRGIVQTLLNDGVVKRGGAKYNGLKKLI